MSKVDALRAMREAKYARAGAPPQPPGTATPRAAGTAAARAAKPQTRSAATAQGPVEETAAETDELCGHRNMGGKSCSRPAGHSEKNHRYATA